MGFINVIINYIYDFCTLIARSTKYPTFEYEVYFKFTDTVTGRDNNCTFVSRLNELII